MLFRSAELLTLTLRNLMPPEAARPHFQEGYLVGTAPSLKPSATSDDLALRMMAKFRIPAECRADFFPSGNPAVTLDYLIPDSDPIALWLEQLPSYEGAQTPAAN